MYTYESALGLSRSIGSQWSEVDLHDILVFNIFQTYTKVYLTLQHDVLTEPVFVDMDVLKPLYGNYSDTLENLLILLGNTTLQTVDSLPNSSVKFAKYSDAVRAGYKIKPTIAGIVVPEEYPSVELKDLEITRGRYSTNMELVHDYCLVSVNGYFHYTDATAQKAYVFDGGITLRHSKLNHLGLLSFLDVGKLQKIKIDPANIVPVTDGTALRDKINFSVNENLDGKSYILILGGYMVLPQQDVFWRSGEHGFTLDINRINYKERFFESRQYLDLSGLGLSQSANGDNVFDYDELMSDAVIKKYMTLSQSFLVIVDVPELVSNKVYLRHSSLPGMFTSYQEPVYPLMVNYGKIAEYWKSSEDGFWSVNVQDSYLRNYIVSQQPVREGQLITDQLDATKPFYHSRGFLLELAGYRT